LLALIYDFFMKNYPEIKKSVSLVTNWILNIIGLTSIVLLISFFFGNDAKRLWLQEENHMFSSHSNIEILSTASLLFILNKNSDFTKEQTYI